MPRQNTDRSRWGACTPSAAAPPPVAGSGPGLTVSSEYRPSGSVALRPKPRKSFQRTAPRGSSGWSNRPSGSACQVSTTASGTGTPAPSYTVPAIRNAPGVPSGTTYGPSGHTRPNEKNGPTVCDGVVRSSLIVVLLVQRRGVLAAQHDVPPVAERPLGHGGVQVEPGHHRLAGLRVADRVEDRVVGAQRVAREVHLGDQPLGERGAEQREVDVRGPPGVVVVAPRVRARLDG